MRGARATGNTRVLSTALVAFLAASVPAEQPVPTWSASKVLKLKDDEVTQAVRARRLTSAMVKKLIKAAQRPGRKRRLTKLYARVVKLEKEGLISQSSLSFGSPVFGYGGGFGPLRPPPPLVAGGQYHPSVQPSMPTALPKTPVTVRAEEDIWFDATDRPRESEQDESQGTIAIRPMTVEGALDDVWHDALDTIGDNSRGTASHSHDQVEEPLASQAYETVVVLERRVDGNPFDDHQVDGTPFEAHQAVDTNPFVEGNPEGHPVDGHADGNPFEDHPINGNPFDGRPADGTPFEAHPAVDTNPFVEGDPEGHPVDGHVDGNPFEDHSDDVTFIQHPEPVVHGEPRQIGGWHSKVDDSMAHLVSGIDINESLPTVSVDDRVLVGGTSSSQAAAITDNATSIPLEAKQLGVTHGYRELAVQMVNAADGASFTDASTNDESATVDGPTNAMQITITSTRPDFFHALSRFLGFQDSSARQLDDGTSGQTIPVRDTVRVLTDDDGDARVALEAGTSAMESWTTVSGKRRKPMKVLLSFSNATNSSVTTTVPLDQMTRWFPESESSSPITADDSSNEFEFDSDQLSWDNDSDQLSWDNNGDLKAAKTMDAQQIYTQLVEWQALVESTFLDNMAWTTLRTDVRKALDRFESVWSASCPPGDPSLLPESTKESTWLVSSMFMAWLRSLQTHGDLQGAEKEWPKERVREALKAFVAVPHPPSDYGVIVAALQSMSPMYDELEKVLNGLTAFANSAEHIGESLVDVARAVMQAHRQPWDLSASTVAAAGKEFLEWLTETNPSPTAVFDRCGELKKILRNAQRERNPFTKFLASVPDAGGFAQRALTDLLEHSRACTANEVDYRRRAWQAGCLWLTGYGGFVNVLRDASPSLIGLQQFNEPEFVAILTAMVADIPIWRTSRKEVSFPEPPVFMADQVGGKSLAELCIHLLYLRNDVKNVMADFQDMLQATNREEILANPYITFVLLLNTRPHSNGQLFELLPKDTQTAVREASDADYCFLEAIDRAFFKVENGSELAIPCDPSLVELFRVSIGECGDQSTELCLSSDNVNDSATLLLKLGAQCSLHELMSEHGGMIFDALLQNRELHPQLNDMLHAVLSAPLSEGLPDWMSGFAEKVNLLGYEAAPSDLIKYLMEDSATVDYARSSTLFEAPEVLLARKWPQPVLKMVVKTLDPINWAACVQETSASEHLGPMFKLLAKHFMKEDVMRKLKDYVVAASKASYCMKDNDLMRCWRRAERLVGLLGELQDRTVIRHVLQTLLAEEADVHRQLVIWLTRQAGAAIPAWKETDDLPTSSAEASAIAESGAPDSAVATPEQFLEFVGHDQNSCKSLLDLCAALVVYKCDPVTVLKQFADKLEISSEPEIARNTLLQYVLLLDTSAMFNGTLFGLLPEKTRYVLCSNDAGAECNRRWLSQANHAFLSA